VLKTLGFTGRHVLAFILGEALVIGILGGVLGIVLTFPVVFLFGKALPTFFPVIGVAPITVVLALLAAAVCGLAAGAAPALRAAKMPIVAGLRTVG
jgi:putative ABC transport system permease protein